MTALVHKALVIDADPAIRRLTTVLLESERYRTFSASSAADGIEQALTHRPDVILLESNLPDVDGFSVLSSLREWYTGVVVILSADPSAAGKALLLDGGADDYLVKPFDGIELLARLRALLRRNGSFAADACLDDGVLRINLGSREISVRGQKLELTATEEAIFYILARHVGGLVTARQCAQAIWGGVSEGKVREVQVYIERLRRKLESLGAPDVIRSVDRSGYRLAFLNYHEHGVTSSAVG